jgi:hypothetical protein
MILCRFWIKNRGGDVMSQSVVTKYEVYRDAEKIRLEEITWEKKETGEPSLKGRVLIDGRTIENVTFKRDITSKAYAMPPLTYEDQSCGVIILFGGVVQEILDNLKEWSRSVTTSFHALYRKLYPLFSTKIILLQLF